MKNIIAIACVLLLVGCNDSFLERMPETTISPEVFFNNVQDLKLYTNTYYEYIEPQFRDDVTDNCAVFSDVSEMLNLIRGNISPSTVSGWNNWDKLRRFNFMLDNVHKATGDADEINHYIGLTRLMRACWYYEMVKRYNDVPWYSQAIKDTDEELLYKKQDTRTVVVDSILSDLDYAVNHISAETGNKTQISKWYAYACMARICLHEGTFRKYHDELNLQATADRFLQKTIWASEAIMESGQFQIDKTGTAYTAYQALFINENLSKSPEIILFKDYDYTANIKHSASYFVFDFITALSRSLMESYQVLTKDGTAVPFSSVEGYETKTFVEVFENRDPRLAQTFMTPGYMKPNQSNPYKPNLNLGGYPQLKFVPQKPDQVSSFTNYTDLPVCRLAEILLIYAEAKAELGELVQSDLDKSVNLIRDRVNMPPVVIGNIVYDPSLEKTYPNVTGRQKELILEIRRERRVELACEGFRLDDLMRWKAGHLLAQQQQGVYIDQLGLHDFTGDGLPDIGIFESEEANTVPPDQRDQYSFYYLTNTTGNTIYLSGGSAGYIMFVGDRDGVREFIEPRYYFFPIPMEQRILNSNLHETIFW
ncbi:MAG: RagB/SusD family nutrient uptake outer membrane protein [Tannerellaceae bacterium]|nr:RagB/SusD family nutrient uptake outer membrane protein [Tannerellaceae bacterium]